MSLSVEQLRALSEKIALNPDAVDELTPDQCTEVRKYLNPLGNVVTTKKIYANLSLINWKEKYLRRLHTTGLIGYTYRVLDEYEPEAELAQATDPEHADKIRKTVRAIVKRFLDRNFEYNPDRHLRGSHSENPADPERRPIDECIREKCATAAGAATIETKLQSRPEQLYTYLRSQLLGTYQAAIEATAAIKSTIAVCIDPAVSLADKQGILFKKYKRLLDITEDMKILAEPIAAADTLAALNIDPPQDMFYQFDRYLTNHYEQLREVCAAVYNEKPDFEYACVLYDAFKTPEAARDYRVQHEAEFRTEVLTIENSAITLVGPFKENRARVDFYNKNTEVMKRMMEQMESDHRLGKDLMEKQVRAQKRRNIEEAGPDHPALAAYAKTMGEVQQFGAKKILTREDQEAMAAAADRARAIKEDYETPEDAVAVDMFFPRTGADGTTTLEKTKFYTQAEAPLHMQEGSQYNNTYQPPRRPGQSLEDSYRTKVITGRDGRKMEIKVPAANKK